MGSESIEAVTTINSSSSSGEKVFPPGFRFHPTDEELILYYLKRKICGRSLKLDIIGEVDVYKWHPEELPGQSKWKTGDRQWFFFSPRDRRYPNGARSNRATMHGYWKATGKDRIIKCNARVVGLKKTLVYYHGRAPSGQRTDWVMHEYTLDENELKRCRYMQDYYALYKVFKKSGPGPKNGEQYGAPFVEEEWGDGDDDYFDVDALLMQNITSLVNEPKSTAEAEKESQENLLACSLTQVEDVDQRLAMGSSHNMLHVQPGSDLAQSANEPSVITAVEEVQPLVVNEDFLELDDLISPQPAFQNSELPVLDDLQFADFDGFFAYSDSTTFNRLNPFKSQHIQQPSCTSSQEYEAINSEFLTGHDLWTQTSEANISSSSGVIINEMPENPDSSVNQYQEFGEDDGSNSWFASALWAFAELVPSKPASALESGGLVNKGISRIKNANRWGRGNLKITTRRVYQSSKSRRGVVYFSVLGVLFAILCVCVGTFVELLGKNTVDDCVEHRKFCCIV